MAHGQLAYLEQCLLRRRARYLARRAAAPAAAAGPSTWRRLSTEHALLALGEQHALEDATAALL